MILKEIEMDMPYVRETNLLSEIEIRKDYLINWKEKRRKFQLSTRCMTSMIERLLPRIVTDKCWKLLIECVENITKEDITDLLGVYCVQVKFDFVYFSNINEEEKKKYIILKIREALSNRQLQTVISTSEIEEVCDNIHTLNYCNEWYWKKAVKKKKRKAQIKLVHDIDSVQIYMQVYDEDSCILKEKLLITTIPDERVYCKYLGNVVWISDNSVVLITKSGDKFQMDL